MGRHITALLIIVVQRSYGATISLGLGLRCVTIQGPVQLANCKQHQGVF
jgi:hypothetical protein